MSYISFLRQGTHGSSFEAHRRDHYAPDCIQTIASTNNYTGTIKKIALDNDKQEALIDGAVKITTVADAVRAKAQSVWSRLNSASLKGFAVSLIAGVAGIAGAIVQGALLPHLWPIVLAVGAVALAVLAFSLFSFSRAREAKLQLKKWSDPAMRIQAQRTKVGQDGFYFAYQLKLKDTVVSSEELMSLWYKDMDHYAEKFEQAVVATPTLISTFMDKSPIEATPFTYTFGEKDLKGEAGALKKLSAKFCGLKKQYDDIRHETALAKESISREKQRALMRNDMQKDAMLDPYRALVEPKRGALMMRQQRLERMIYEEHRLQPMPAYGVVAHGTSATLAYVDHSRIRQCRQDLQEVRSELAHIDLIYSAMTAPVCALHQRNAQSIRDWAFAEISGLQKKEEKVLLKFFDPIKAFLKEYSNRILDEKKAEVDEIAKINDDIEPAAPSLEEDCQLPEFDPQWSSIVSEMDWEKGILKTTRTAKESTTTTIKHF